MAKGPSMTFSLVFYAIIFVGVFIILVCIHK